MSNWVVRLKQKMQELQLTQEELAKKMGVTRSAVAHYVQGTRQPPLRQMVKLAAALKTDPSWLQFGKTSESATPSRLSIKKSSSRIPVLDWESAKKFDPEGSQDTSEYLEYFNCDQIACYALLIKGDSMVSSMNQGVSFNPGSFVVVDPNKEPAHGSFVVVTTSNRNEAILRQYVVEGSIVYLKPLNPQYPLMQYERATKILGTVIANIAVFQHQ